MRYHLIQFYFAEVSASASAAPADYENAGSRYVARPPRPRWPYSQSARQTQGGFGPPWMAIADPARQRPCMASPVGERLSAHGGAGNWLTRRAVPDRWRARGRWNGRSLPRSRY